MLRINGQLCSLVLTNNESYPYLQGQKNRPPVPVTHVDIEKSDIYNVSVYLEMKRRKGKLKKTVVMILTIAIAGTLAGCQPGENHTTASQAEAGKKQTVAKSDPGHKEYTIKKVIYTDKDIKAEYPQIEGFADAARQRKINELIKSEALAPYLRTIKELDPIQKYEADGKYEIKLQNDNILSITYSSFNNIVPSAHPYNMFYTTNIDLKTGKKLVLKDLVPNIDKAFIEVLKNSKYAGNIDKQYEPEIRTQAFSWYENDEQLLDALSSKSETESNIYVYVTPDSLGISMPITHAAGDHAEFEINCSDLTSLNIRKWN